MKLRLINFVSIILTVFFICGCFYESKAEVKPEESLAAELDPVENILQSMTLEEKIGQMIMIGIYGTDINDDINFMLNEYHFGGIVFFDRNMDSKAQVKNFSEKLQDISLNSGKKIPLFIAVDEEGGRVARMKHDLTPPPSQEEIGMSGDYNWAKSSAVTVANELRNIGINVNFAPVADVGGNDTRSFSNNAGIVAEFIENAAEGYEEENFFYCLKHFPGIGRGKIDTHKDISEVDVEKKILYEEDILPFKQIISGHDNSKFMVMVGHLKYLALDSDNAASLSREIITEILRNELNFQGVVITDDLNMGAIANYSDIETVCLQTIKAGTDIALICHEPELQQRAYNAILNAVKLGEISEERINQSVTRILKMKMNL